MLRTFGLSSLIYASCDTQGLKMSVLWTMFYGLMSAFAPIYGWILVLRALVGFGIGGAPQS